MSVAMGLRFFRFAVFVVIAVAIFLVSDVAILLGGSSAIASSLGNTTWIADLPITQFTEQPATLVGPRPNYAVPLYIRPAPNQQPVGYGMSGDAVTVTDQFGDYLMEDDPSATWSHIRLEKAPYTEGWLRGRFLSMQTPEQTAEQAAEPSD